MELAFNKAESGGTYPVDVKDEVFGVSYRSALVHQVVNAQQARSRRGTRAQKRRSDVRGGGRKPWRQKGTGRARAGSLRSPLWRGGGVTFAARPRSYEQKVNRKMFRGALCSILSELVRQERLVGVDALVVSDCRTRSAKGLLERLGVEDVLILVDREYPELELGVRNLPAVSVRRADAVDAYRLLAHSKVLMTEPALRIIEERLSDTGPKVANHAV